MYRILYMSHSGLRYLVLLAGIIALAYGLFALFSKKPWNAAGRGLGSSFVGLLDLQIVLGLVLIFFRYYPALIGHLAMMVVGAITAHALMVVNRKRAVPSWGMLVLAVGIALLCIVIGIYAIPGRAPFRMVPL